MKNTIRTPYPTHKRQQGFTLLELLVVVSVLASLAGIAAVAMDGYEQDAQEQLVHVEMKRIANAIYRFKEDTGYFPEQGVFSEGSSAHENLSWLFTNPVDDSKNKILPWNPISGRGWNGPYITLESGQIYSTQDCDLDVTGTDYSFTSLSDPFERKKSYTTSGDDCFLVHTSDGWVSREFSGMPYQYNTDYYRDWVTECPDDEHTCIVIVSAGKDSTFDTGEDIVFVLEKN